MENPITVVVDLLELHKKLSALEDILFLTNQTARAKILHPALELVEKLHSEMPKGQKKPEGVSDFKFRDDQLQQTLKDLGEILKMAVPKDIHYVLLLSRTGEGGGLFYISTVERASAVELLKEFIEKQSK